MRNRDTKQVKRAYKHYSEALRRTHPLYYQRHRDKFDMVK